jgi:hypothetical protein
MRRWLLARLGALAWLKDIEIFAGRAVAAEDRRDRWRTRAEESAAEVIALKSELTASQEKAQKFAAQVSAFRVEMEALRREHDAALHMIRAQDAIIGQLTEIDNSKLCSKIRCYSKDLAERFARMVERERGLPAMSMTTYTCDRCPIQPVTGERWHHVTMADEKLRGMAKYRVKRGWVGHGRTSAMSEEQAAELSTRLFGGDLSDTEERQ